MRRAPKVIGASSRIKSHQLVAEAQARRPRQRWHLRVPAVDCPRAELSALLGTGEPRAGENVESHKEPMPMGALGRWPQRKRSTRSDLHLAGDQQSGSLRLQKQRDAIVQLFADVQGDPAPTPATSPNA